MIFRISYKSTRMARFSSLILRIWSRIFVLRRRTSTPNCHHFLLFFVKLLEKIYLENSFLKFFGLKEVINFLNSSLSLLIVKFKCIERMNEE